MSLHFAHSLLQTQERSLARDRKLLTAKLRKLADDLLHAADVIDNDPRAIPREGILQRVGATIDCDCAALATSYEALLFTKGMLEELAARGAGLPHAPHAASLSKESCEDES